MPLELDSDNFAQYVKDDSNIIIKFTAPTWCGPCKRMAPEYHKAEEFMNEIKSNLVFSFLDVDDNSELASKYEISSLPTLVLIKDGKEVDRHKGGLDCKDILLFIGKHFDVNTSS
jgi:thioredoxin